MPEYFYTAKSFKGEKETGALIAKDKSRLARALRRRGFILVSAQEVGKEKSKLEIAIPFLDRVSLTEKMMFTRNLEVMVSAGISLPRALDILAQQAKSRSFKKILLDIRDEIFKGKSFSKSLEKYPDTFPKFFSSMIKVGEVSGRLEEVLATLTKQMLRQYELSSSIKGAMIYPAVIIVAMLGIGAAMLVFVVPQIAETLKELKVDLPATTKFVIWLGETAADRWYLLLLSVFLLVFLFWRTIKTKLGKNIIDSLSLKIPIFSLIVKKANSANMARTLSSLISAGVPLTESLRIVADSSNNVLYKKALLESAEGVVKGKKISETLRNYQNLYPFLVIQMITVGEETGRTSTILEKLADFFEAEVSDAAQNLAAIIEPLVMLLIGGAVGFFAISMIQPMYSMLGAIQ